MIAHLSGTILFRGTKHLLIDVGGVAYKVYASLETLRLVGSAGEKAELFTYLYLRENAMELYGFASMAEQEFFELLIGISGIGPKSAIGVMSVAPLDTLKRAIASGDTAYLTKVSGIGKRIAEKIIVELREKLAGGAIDGLSPNESDALDALISLGYSTREAREALQKVSMDVVELDERVRAALKFLGRSRS